MKPTPPHHYTECGLDYIYLTDGFEVIRTDHGPVVHIENASKLDRAIASTVIRFRKRLGGNEVRFLRGLMDWTQEELGQTLGKDAQAVARWEKGKTQLPSTEDIAIRQIYLELSGSRQKWLETSRMVSALTHQIKSIKFKAAGGRGGRPTTWSVAT